MSAENPNGGSRPANDGWQQRVGGAVERAEQELKSLIAYLNDEVVPDVRRSGSEALRSAAAELGRLAERMDDHRAGRGPGSNPKP